MFGTKGVTAQEPRKASKYFSYGNQELFIYDIEVKTASTGSKQLTLHMETPPIEGLEPEEGHKGQVGRVAFPGAFIKMDDTQAVERFNKDIALIADKLGVRAELDNVTASDFDSYINAIKPLFIKKPAFWCIAAEEYNKADGKVGVRLKTRRYSFIASIQEGIDHLEKFDKSKAYNFKPVPKPDADSQVTSATLVNDLPF